MIQRRRENHVLIEATIKGKTMLPIGSIFFPLLLFSDKKH